MLGFSFYGRTEPRWLVFLCWFLFFSWPVVFMLSPGYGESFFTFSIVSGLFVVASSIKLRSVLLFLIGLFLAASYYVVALVLMGTGP